MNIEDLFGIPMRAGHVCFRGNHNILQAKLSIDHIITCEFFPSFEHSATFIQVSTSRCPYEFEEYELHGWNKAYVGLYHDNEVEAYEIIDCTETIDLNLFDNLLLSSSKEGFVLDGISYKASLDTVDTKCQFTFHNPIDKSITDLFDRVSEYCMNQFNNPLITEYFEKSI